MEKEGQVGKNVQKGKKLELGYFLPSRQAVNPIPFAYS